MYTGAIYSLYSSLAKNQVAKGVDGIENGERVSLSPAD